jgi:peptidylprolyl isomerase
VAVLSAAAMLVLVTAPLHRPAAAADAAATIVAKVGSSEVTLGEVRALLQTLDVPVRAELIKDPALLNRLVRSYAARAAVLSEAKAKGWEKKPDVAAQLERIRNEAIVSTYLNAETRPPAGFPSDAEIQAAYDTNKARFMMPRQFEIAQIFLAVAAGADQAEQEKVRKRLDEVQKKLRQSPAAFAELARQYSDDAATARSGGTIGWVTETAMIADIRAAVLSLEKGGIAEPLALADGWHIIRLIDTKPAAVRPLPEVRQAIIDGLREQRQAENEQAYLARLLEKSPPAINELALPQVLQGLAPQ